MTYKDPNYMKEYRLKNEEIITKQRIEYNLKNKEKIKEQHQKYNLENKEQIKKQTKEYRFENKEKLNELNKKLYLKNKEKRIKQITKWSLENPEKRLAIHIRHLTKMGKELKMPYRKFEWALQEFSLAVRKKQGRYCQICGSLNKISVHHILHKIKYPKLSLVMNNGIVLCVEHHSEAHGRFESPPPALTSILSQTKPIILIN